MPGSSSEPTKSIHVVAPLWESTPFSQAMGAPVWLKDASILVEPACGAALSTVYGQAAPLAGHDPIVVIVCGGAGVTRQLLGKWDRQTEHEKDNAARHTG